MDNIMKNQAPKPTAIITPSHGNSACITGQFFATMVTMSRMSLGSISAPTVPASEIG